MGGHGKPRPDQGSPGASTVMRRPMPAGSFHAGPAVHSMAVPDDLYINIRLRRAVGCVGLLRISWLTVAAGTIGEAYRLRSSSVDVCFLPGGPVPAVQISGAQRP